MSWSRSREKERGREGERGRGGERENPKIWCTPPPNFSCPSNVGDGSDVVCENPDILDVFDPRATEATMLDDTPSKKGSCFVGIFRRRIGKEGEEYSGNNNTANGSGQQRHHPCRSDRELPISRSQHGD